MADLGLLILLSTPLILIICITIVICVKIKEDGKTRRMEQENNGGEE